MSIGFGEKKYFLYPLLVFSLVFSQMLAFSKLRVTHYLQLKKDSEQIRIPFFIWWIPCKPILPRNEWQDSENLHREALFSLLLPLFPEFPKPRECRFP